MKGRISLEKALSLNNEAVLLLVAGRERKALESLQQAVGLVKRNIARQLQDRRNGTKGLCSSDERNRNIDQPVLSLRQLHHDSVQLSGLANLQCYVFNRAFRISEDQLPSDIEWAVQIGSAMIIFNMALVLHRACLLRNRTVPACKSLALYKIVLHLVKSSSNIITGGSSSSQDGLADAIQLAALNNISQLHFEEGDYTNATRGFSSLANLMTTIPQNPLLGDNEMRGIVINVMCMKMGAKLAPAA